MGLFAAWSQGNKGKSKDHWFLAAFLHPFAAVGKRVSRRSAKYPFLWRKNERAVEDAGPYKGLGESAPVSGGASMRAAGDAGPYGSESGAVSKFENISKRTDTSTTRAGATRGGITNNIKNHEASQKPPLRSNGAAHYRAERGSGSDKRSVSDSLYDDVQHLGFRGVRGDRFLTYPNRAGSLETCGFKQRFWSLLGLRPKVTRARKRGTFPFRC